MRAAERSPAAAALHGIDVVAGHAVVEALGEQGVEAVRVAPHRRRRPGPRASPRTRCWSRAAGRRRRTCSAMPAAACATTRVASRTFRRRTATGACAARAPPPAAATWRRRSPTGGRAAARQPRPSAGRRPRTQAPPVTDPPPATAPPRALWLVPSPDGRWDRHFVDLQRDVTVADLQRSVSAGLRSPEHVKRYTTLGTGADQGRTSGVLGLRRGGAAARRRPGGAGPDDGPAARSAAELRAARRPRPRRAARSGARHADARASPGGRRGLRGRRPVEAPVVLPARRRGPRCGRGPRVPGRAGGRRDDGRLDARQDRRPRPGRRGVPQPDVHGRLRQARAGDVQVRDPVPRRRHGVRRRRHDARRRGPLPGHDDHRQRGRGPRLVRGVAADRVARAARALHVGDRAVGHGGDRRSARPRRPGAAGGGPRARQRVAPVHGDPRGGGRGDPGPRLPGLVLR